MYVLYAVFSFTLSYFTRISPNSQPATVSMNFIYIFFAICFVVFLNSHYTFSYYIHSLTHSHTHTSLHRSNLNSGSMLQHTTVVAAVAAVAAATVSNK